MNLQENISRIKEMMGLLIEKREGWYNLLRKKLPNMPEYVLKDWIYRKVDDYKDYESFNNWLDEWIVGFLLMVLLYKQKYPHHFYLLLLIEL